MTDMAGEPDYYLLWPRWLFVEQAAGLLGDRALDDWDNRCAALLRDAFVHRPTSVVLSRFFSQRNSDADPSLAAVQGASSSFTARQMYLVDLIRDADQLRDTPPPRRVYYRERKTRIGASSDQQLDNSAVIDTYIDLVGDLDELGYFDRYFTRDCVDDIRAGQPAEYLRRNLHEEVRWPLNSSQLSSDIELFYDVVEVLHDAAARPRTIDFNHTFCDCGWHMGDFDTRIGQTVYRWRVNQILDDSGTGLRLADDGDTTGQLTTATDAARTDLVHRTMERTATPSTDRVRHGIEQFRKRGATRTDKRAAARDLADVLEQRRKNVLTDALAKTHAGELFHIANKFDIRHHTDDQKSDYPEYYLDWIFWLYLATIELTNNVIDDQTNSVTTTE